jgi:hypothetical protein
VADSNNGGLTSASAYWDNGDIKALRRAVWNDPTSKMQAWAGGSYGYHDSAPYGREKNNWDQPEGYMPRVLDWGGIAPPQWSGVNANGIAGHTTTGYYGQNIYRTLTTGAVGKTTYTRMPYMTNTTGNLSDENYTDGWHNVDSSHVLGETLSGGYWHLSTFARKHISMTNTQRFSMWIFGCTTVDGGSTYAYNHGSDNIVDATSTNGGWFDQPATGGSTYFAQFELNTSHTFYEMFVKLDHTYSKTHITIRFDNDDGKPGGTSYVYFDRPTLIPYNLGLRESEVDGSSGEVRLDDATFGPYYT